MIGIGSSLNIEGFSDNIDQLILSLFSSNKSIALGLVDSLDQSILS